MHPSVSICHMLFSAFHFTSGSSVCVHVVVGCFRSSSQRRRWLRFRGDFFVSALIEQHVGCFSLQGEGKDRITLQKQGHSTPMTKSQGGLLYQLSFNRQKTKHSLYTTCLRGLHSVRHRFMNIKESKPTTIWSSEADETLLSSK